MTLTLYDYWRSSASYRVRIALNLLGECYETTSVDLLKKAHLSEVYRAMNPQGLVPSLAADGTLMTQSLSIIEYLHEVSDSSTLLPEDPLGRARVRQLAYIIAMEIHPVCNLAVATHVGQLASDDATEAEQVRQDWMRHYIAKGLSAVEALLKSDATGDFCHGAHPTIADVCLVPQVYNARRWNVDLSGLTEVMRIDALCGTIPAFQNAVPERVKPSI